MPSRKNRVTRWTDDRGNVLADFWTLYAQRAIKAARDAGIPAKLLHKAGWNNDEDDIAGLFTDYIYRIGELPIHGPLPMSDAEQLISAMVSVCQSVGVDYRKAIPFGHLRFIRDLRERNEELEALKAGTWTAPDATENDYQEGAWE